MKRILFMAGAMLAMCGSVLAADLPKVLKAPATTPTGCTKDYCVSWIVGADVTGVASSVDVFGSGIGGSFNGGGTLLGAHAGGRLWNGTFYIGFEVGGTYDVAGGASGVAPGFGDRFAAMEIVRAGGPIGAIFGNSQGFTFPAALQPYLMSLYANIGGKQRMGSTGFVTGAGAEFIITPNATVSLDYFHVDYSGAGATNMPSVLALKNEDLARLSFNWNFPVTR
jgi:hypothetical protein